jgi:bud site selection protein 20
MSAGVGLVSKHKGTNKRGRRKRTLAWTVDQIIEDLVDPLRAEASRSKQPIDFEFPGLGQHCCIECAGYFIDSNVLVPHAATKLHKSRVRAQGEAAFSGGDGGGQ